ncbi:MAG: 4Fe-4S dicluster domain-containing protein [Candidatus Adiutrix sp.]|jgi:Fe-S-cluster-containing dehydrogenase component|nr:4Fe-4S dicluster domain-containing protein [Candidatus Adiutrix sp.]
MSEFALKCLSDRCVGCAACVAACYDQNDLEPEKGDQPLRRLIQIESDDPASPPISYVSSACRHCLESPCLKVCPHAAIYRDERFGAVLIDRDKCLGCGTCAQACPFEAPVLNRQGLMTKCDLCYERLQAGLKPACVKVCPYQALSYYFTASEV